MTIPSVSSPGVTNMHSSLQSMGVETLPFPFNYLTQVSGGCLGVEKDLRICEVFSHSGCIFILVREVWKVKQGVVPILWLRPLTLS